MGCLEGCLEHLDLLLCFLLTLLSDDRVQVCSHLCTVLVCPGLLVEPDLQDSSESSWQQLTRS